MVTEGAMGRTLTLYMHRPPLTCSLKSETVPWPARESLDGELTTNAKSQH